MRRQQARAIPMVPSLEIALSDRSYIILATMLALLIAASLVYLAQMRSEHHRYNADVNAHRQMIHDLNTATKLLTSMKSEISQQEQVYQIASEELKMSLPVRSKVITLNLSKN